MNKSNKRVFSADEVKSLALELAKKGFTDGLDASPEESLLEYGILRRPEDGKAVNAMRYGKSYILYCQFLTLEDVKDGLEGMDDESRNGFYDFIDRKVETKDLNNEYLSDIIHSLNMWDGCFIIETMATGDSMEYIESFVNK